MARYQEENAQLMQMPDTGAADVATNLARKLGAFGDIVGKERAAKVVAESQKLGTKAGLEGAPELKSEFSLAGQAFNKAATAAYTSGIENDFRENISRLAQENPDDIAAFTAKAESYRLGALQSIPENLRDDLQMSLDTHISRAATAVQGNAIQKEERLNQYELETNANGSASEAFRLARSGDEDGSLLEQLKANDVVDSMNVDEPTKAKYKAQYNQERIEQKYRGLGDRLYTSGGLDAVNDWLNENEGKELDGLDFDTSQAITNAMQADANRKASREKAQRAIANEAGKQSLKDYANAKSFGFEIDKQQELELISLIKDSPELMKQKNIIDKTASFSVESAEDRQAKLDAMQTGKLEDVDQFLAYTKKNDEINKLALKDGYTLGVKQGLADYVPLNINDPASFQQRISQAAELSKHYGVPVSPLADAEVQGLTENLPNMTVPEKIALANTLSAAPQVWNEIDKKGAGTFAMAGATGDYNVMTSVFKGQEMLANNVIKLPSQKEYLAEFQDLTGGIYKPRDAKAMLDATLAHYAATYEGAASGEFDKKAFEVSLQAVSGGIDEVNGFKVELPRGVDVDDFQDFIDELQPETIESLGGVANYKNEKAEGVESEAVQAIQGGRIISIGTNRYVVLTSGGTLLNKSGKPFEFSYNLDTVAANKALYDKQKRLEKAEYEFRRM